MNFHSPWLRREWAIDHELDGCAGDAGDACGEAAFIDQEAGELAGMNSRRGREFGDYTRTVNASAVRCFETHDAGFEKPNGPRAQHHDGEEQEPDGASRTPIGM